MVVQAALPTRLSPPLGLYAAYCNGFRGLRTAVVDTLPEVGGQVAAMYPEKAIYDTPAIHGSRAASGSRD